MGTPTVLKASLGQLSYSARGGSWGPVASPPDDTTHQRVYLYSSPLRLLGVFSCLSIPQKHTSQGSPQNEDRGSLGKESG